MNARYPLLISLLALLLLSGIVLAQGDYQITRWAVTGIAGQPSGGNFSLSSTIGPSDAAEMAGGGYTLQGGLVAGGGATEWTIYLPSVQR